MDPIEKPVTGRGLLILQLLAVGYPRHIVADLVGGRAVVERELCDATRALGVRDTAHAIDLLVQRRIILRGPVPPDTHDVTTGRLVPRRAAPVTPSTRFPAVLEGATGRYGVWDDQLQIWAMPTFSLKSVAIGIAESSQSTRDGAPGTARLRAG